MLDHLCISANCNLIYWTSFLLVTACCYSKMIEFSFKNIWIALGLSQVISFSITSYYFPYFTWHLLYYLSLIPNLFFIYLSNFDQQDSLNSCLSHDLSSTFHNPFIIFVIFRHLNPYIFWIDHNVLLMVMKIYSLFDFKPKVELLYSYHLMMSKLSFEYLFTYQLIHSFEN